MKIRSEMSQHIIESEGYKSEVCRDTALKSTLGVGHLVVASDITEERQLNQGDIVSDEDIMKWFTSDQMTAEDGVRSLVGDMSLSQNEFDAMADLVFNVGITKLRNKAKNPGLHKAIADKDHAAISGQLRYTKDANGNSPAGLTTRSNKRKQMFLRDY